jgi:hypothetical protein
MTLTSSTTSGVRARPRHLKTNETVNGFLKKITVHARRQPDEQMMWKGFPLATTRRTVSWFHLHGMCHMNDNRDVYDATCTQLAFALNGRVEVKRQRLVCRCLPARSVQQFVVYLETSWILSETLTLVFAIPLPTTVHQLERNEVAA